MPNKPLTMSAIIWMLQNPNKGIMYPDELPFEPILKGAELYWGGYHSLQTDFKPSQMKVHPFCADDHDNTWQFMHFLAKK